MLLLEGLFKRFSEETLDKVFVILSKVSFI